MVGLRALMALSLFGCALDSSGAGAGGASSSASGSMSGGHECLSGEARCSGECVNLDDDLSHCGACDNPCVTAFDRAGQCVDGGCVYECNDGFVEEQGHCKNFFGAHQAFPVDCPGCRTPDPYTRACGCPSTSSELSLAAQSDCPDFALRSPTSFNLCVTPGVSAESDFGGAYQVDDSDGWCGATARCRVGNPLAGGACACPLGLDESIALRSIIRLACDGDEVGTYVVICGNKDVPIRSFGGAFQVDDFEPACRVVNPWTGDCSCPEATTDHVFRVMVDGIPGLYGSTFHVCTP